jgi:zinc transport system substrate-binding protein
VKNSIIILLMLLTLVGCKQKVDPNRPVITVSIEPLRYFTEQIVGDKFSVVTMVPNGSSPETYEPTAQQMIDLVHSGLFVMVGQLGYERTWMKRMESTAPHTLVVNSSEGINLISTGKGVSDPHVWMSTVNAMVIARNIYQRIIDVDSRDSLYFRQNLEQLMSKIESTDTKIRECFTRDKSAAFLIYHPALTYYARDYRLRQIPVEEEGHEPSAAQLKQTILEARRWAVKTMLVQKQFQNRNTQIVAKAVGAKQQEINPLSYNWSDEMLKIAQLMK